MDARGLATAPRTERRLRVREEALALLRASGAILPQRELTRMVNEVSDEVVGFGPIEFLLKDPDVTEVMVNGPDDVYVEREGRIERAPDGLFEGEEAVLHLIERIVGPLGLRVDESSPWADARLPEGSRVHAIIPPLSLRGPALTIRKFSPVPITAEDLVAGGCVGPRMFRFLSSCVRGRANMIVSGGAGTGKTTMLGILSASIPDDERLITIEDAAELRLAKPHVVSLEARPANVEGRGEVTVRDLVRNALRMRPDRIIVGEVRGGETLDMLQAMNTGHEGSLSTAHANSTRHLLWRLETMAMMSDVDLPAAHIRTQVCAGGRRDRASRAAPWRTPRRVGDRCRRGHPSWRTRRDAAVPLPAQGRCGGRLRGHGRGPRSRRHAREPWRACRTGSVRGGSGSMIVAPALFVVAGIMAGAAVRCVERTDVWGRIAQSGPQSTGRRQRPAMPGLGWRWWPVVAAVAGWFLGGAVTAAIGFLVVKVGAAVWRRRRNSRLAAALDEQLADAVRSLAAGMRAGFSVPQAIAFAAREGEPPLATALARIVDSVGLGGGLDDALERWATEVGTDDARLVVGVLALHRRSGGDLPHVLDQVAATLRERSSAAREVRALTAQARLSGAILGLLPIGFFAFLWMTSRGDIQGAFDSPIGVGAVVAGLALEGVAFLWIRSLLEVT